MGKADSDLDRASHDPLQGPTLSLCTKPGLLKREKERPVQIKAEKLGEGRQALEWKRRRKPTG